MFYSTANRGSYPIGTSTPPDFNGTAKDLKSPQSKILDNQTIPKPVKFGSRYDTETLRSNRYCRGCEKARTSG
jgi:hypothetical protein